MSNFQVGQIVYYPLADKALTGGEQFTYPGTITKIMTRKGVTRCKVLSGGRGWRSEKYWNEDQLIAEAVFDKAEAGALIAGRRG